MPNAPFLDEAFFSFGAAWLLRHRELLGLRRLRAVRLLHLRHLRVRIRVRAAADVLGDRLVRDGPLVRTDQLALVVEAAEALELEAVEPGLVDRRLIERHLFVEALLGAVRRLLEDFALEHDLVPRA